MIDKVQEIINRSGNNLHSKVIKFLRERGWRVLVSPYYCDNQTNKAREIDLIAEKEIDITTINSSVGTLNIKLYIECKYINDETIFWFDEKDLESAENMVIETTCIAETIRQVPLIDRKHHYLSNNKVAKLFSANSKKASENEDFFKAVNQTLNGMIYHRNRRSIMKNIKRRDFQHIAHYPIILCNNFEKLYSTNFGKQECNKINISNFELEINYSFIGNQVGTVFDKYFLVDVVDFSRFGEYLDMISQKDVVEMIGYITHGP